MEGVQSIHYGMGVECKGSRIWLSGMGGLWNLPASSGCSDIRWDNEWIVLFRVPGIYRAFNKVSGNGLENLKPLKNTKDTNIVRNVNTLKHNEILESH